MTDTNVIKFGALGPYFFAYKITHPTNGQWIRSVVAAASEEQALAGVQAIANGIDSFDWPRSSDCDCEILFECVDTGTITITHDGRQVGEMVVDLN